MDEIGRRFGVAEPLDMQEWLPASAVDLWRVVGCPLTGLDIC